MKAESWLWPDRRIGKRESRELREEHNALVNAYATLQDAARAARTVLDKGGWGDDASHILGTALEEVSR